jgi:hypothetical protein
MVDFRRLVMNIMLILVAMGLVCGVIGLFVGIRNSPEEERRHAGRKGAHSPVAHVAVLCLLTACLPLAAQEVVHAQTGKVVDVDSARKTLTLKLADGSKVNYQDISSHEPALSLDKAVREKTVPVATFNKVGANVVVLYFGYDSPTAIAVRELGAAAPKTSTGSVSNFDRHLHSLTLKTDAAQPQKLVWPTTNPPRETICAVSPVRIPRPPCLSSRNNWRFW